MQELSKEISSRHQEILEKIMNFSDRHLNSQYKDKCVNAAETLFLNNSEQLVKGKSESWAAGIIHAIGSENNLFDSKTQPYIKAFELYKEFGISSSTGSAKSKEIKKLLDLDADNSRWKLESREVAAEEKDAPINFLSAYKEKKNDKFIVKKEYFEAEAVIEKAKKEKNFKKRMMYAKEAIEIYEDCSDAYIILAMNNKLEEEEKAAFFEEAVERAKNVLEITEFEKADKRKFNLPQAEKLFGAEYIYSMSLWKTERRKEAIDNLYKVFLYDKSRKFIPEGILSSWLTIEKRYDETLKVTEEYTNGVLSAVLYNRAAALYMKKNYKEADKVLKKAYKNNKYIIEKLLNGKFNENVKLPYNIIVGSREEAEEYIEYGRWIWNQPELKKWLKSSKMNFEILKI